MNLPVASISLNMAETTYVLNSIDSFINEAAPEYNASDNYVQSLFCLAHDCKNIWSDQEWNSYQALYSNNLLSNDNLVKKSKIDHNSYWTISIVDCDAVILAMQYFSKVSCEKSNSDTETAKYYQHAINSILIPRFTSVFTSDEWNDYNDAIDKIN